MTKSNKARALVAVSLILAAGAANAAIPTEAQGALDSIGEFSSAVTTWMWSIGTAITVAFVGLKLVRKGANKAT
ncbi:major coat protein [Vibrio vulnificus]|uniref:major coat protein n=1 Tax=Vibrio vulnificus TaxID=672 RepID=UPI0009B5E7DF|nr:major coat protein [Vibrio vulnificus]OQK59630.1 putative secreted protein [Vibrio vulnificus]